MDASLLCPSRWTVWVDSVLDKQWVVEASAADDSEQDKSPQALSDTDIKLWIALSRADITIHTLDAKFAFRLTRYFWEYCQSQIERMDSLEEQVFISSGSDKFANVEIAVFDDLSRPWSKESRNKVEIGRERNRERYVDGDVLICTRCAFKGALPLELGLDLYNVEERPRLIVDSAD